jgi:hypothetical protein
MNVKIHQLTDFPAFFEKVKSQKLPFKTSYRLTMLAQEIEKHVSFYQDSFRNLLMEYGKKDENGNLMPTSDGQGVLLMEETMEEAYGKLAELRDLDVELPDIKFSIDDFEKMELSPTELVIFMPFLED